MNENSNILIVGKNSIELNKIKEILKETNAIFTTISDCTQATEYLKNNDIDLVISVWEQDDACPSLIAKKIQIQNDNIEVPIILITNRILTKTEETFWKSLGLLSILTKPIDSERLLNKVRPVIYYTKYVMKIKQNNKKLISLNSRLEKQIKKNKKIGENLKRIENKFQFSFKNSILGMVITDKNFVIQHINKKMLELFEFNEDVKTLGSLKVYFQNRFPILIEAIVSAIKTKETNYSKLLTYELRNGKIKNFDLNINFLYDENNQFTESLIIIKDITQEQQKHIKALELASIVEHSVDAIFRIDTNGIIKTWNKGANLIFKYDSNEIINQHFTVLVPDKRNILDLIINNEQHYFAQELKISTIGLTKEKNHINLDLVFSPILVNDKIDGISVLGRDTTDRIKKEEEVKNYKYAIDHTLILTMCDYSGQITYVNDNFCKTTHFSREEIIGKNINDFKEFYKDPEIYNEIKQTIIKGSIWEGEVANVKKNGDVYWGYDTIIPYTLPNGIVYKFAIIRIDITKIKLGEEAIKNKILLEKNLKLKDEFLAHISHEIRTPLNSIIGFTDLLLDTEADETHLTYLNYIKNSGILLLYILNDILDLTSLETGNLKLEQTPIDFNEILSNIHTIFAYELKNNKIDFNINIDHKISKNIIGDKKRCEQIVINLIKNSIKFTPKGSINVECKLIDENADFETIEIIVKDTGIGIEPSKQKSIFDPFTQSEDYITRKYIGTGLGLTIVQKLVTLFNGKIEMESQVNKGTQISIKIPFKKSHTYQETQIKILENEDIKFLKNDKKKRILLAEDNENNQILAKLRLNSWGFIVDVATDGIQALEMLTKNEYDLILMDIQMPLLDGYSATKKIRNEFPKEKSSIPIIALTAHASNSEIEIALELGIDAYIFKPFDANELYEKIISLLDLKNMEKQLPKITKIEKTDESYVDFENLFAECLGNTEIIKKIIEAFKREFESYIENATISAHENELEDLYKFTHKILPSIKIFSIDKILHLVELIYFKSKANEEFNYLDVLAEITSAYIYIRKQLNQKLISL